MNPPFRPGDIVLVRAKVVDAPRGCAVRVEIETLPSGGSTRTPQQVLSVPVASVAKAKLVTP